MYLYFVPSTEKKGRAKAAFSTTTPCPGRGKKSNRRGAHSGRRPRAGRAGEEKRRGGGTPREEKKKGKGETRSFRNREGERLGTSRKKDRHARPLVPLSAGQKKEGRKHLVSPSPTRKKEKKEVSRGTVFRPRADRESIHPSWERRLEWYTEVKNGPRTSVRKGKTSHCAAHGKERRKGMRKGKREGSHSEEKGDAQAAHRGVFGSCPRREERRGRKRTHHAGWQEGGKKKKK